MTIAKQLLGKAIQGANKSPEKLLQGNMAQRLLGAVETVLDPSNYDVPGPVGVVRKTSKKLFGTPGYADKNLSMEKRQDDLISRFTFMLPMALSPSPVKTGGKSLEQLAEESAGFKPGTRKTFDEALMNKDKAALTKLLPQIPDSYKVRLFDRINAVMKKP